jgi:hypothetical protein
MILGHGGLELCARAHVVLAKCHLSDLKFSGTLQHFVLYYVDNTSLLCCSLSFEVIILRNLLYVILISTLFPKTSDIHSVFTCAAS